MKTAARTSALTLAALGVVYGDIGTSPLYAFKEVFHAGHVPVTPGNVLGILSLLFWTMTIIVSVKYVLLILRADNNGEGGLIAMMALATTAVAERPALRRTLRAIGKSTEPIEIAARFREGRKAAKRVERGLQLLAAAGVARRAREGWFVADRAS